jgi:hypothetical protein
MLHLGVCVHIHICHYLFFYYVYEKNSMMWIQQEFKAVVVKLSQNLFGLKKTQWTSCVFSIFIGPCSRPNVRTHAHPCAAALDGLLCLPVMLRTPRLLLLQGPRMLLLRLHMRAYA